MADAVPMTGALAEVDAHAVVFSDAPCSEARRQHVDRREERTETSMVATIRLKDGTEIPCIVKDVSKSGAKLGIPRDCVLPESFMFKMNGRDFIFLAKLAWQRDRYAGVRIERIAKLPPSLGSG